MEAKSLGFIGAGRITRILLGGMKRASRLPSKVVVSDHDEEVLQKLKTQFPEIDAIADGNRQAASQDIVFVALHPPVMGGILPGIRSELKPSCILVSLAPKLSLGTLSELLGGFQRIVRMIPNAPSVINEGYNPLAFHPALTGTEKESLLTLFKTLGDCPEVDEKKLESYAILTAMGPTYLWFQLYELQSLGREFGLSDQELKEGMFRMMGGALKTMFEAGLSPGEVMNLVPVKPIGDEEENIRKVYRSRLTTLYQKLKS